MVIGTYHGVRKDFMQSYMDEFSYRYNNRKNVDVFRTLLSDICFGIKQKRGALIELFKMQDTGAQSAAA